MSRSPRGHVARDTRDAESGCTEVIVPCDSSLRHQSIIQRDYARPSTRPAAKKQSSLSSMSKSPRGGGHDNGNVESESTEVVVSCDSSQNSQSLIQRGSAHQSTRSAAEMQSSMSCRSVPPRGSMIRDTGDVESEFTEDDESEPDPNSLRRIVAKESERIARQDAATRRAAAEAERHSANRTAVAEAIAAQGLSADEPRELVGMHSLFQWVAPLSRTRVVAHLDQLEAEQL